MSKQEKDILLSTKPMGFDKKKTMDYIEKIQLENEGLKRQIQDLSAKQNALLKENAMLRARLDVGEKAPAQAPAPAPEPEPDLLPQNFENYGSQVSSRIRSENLADLDASSDFEMPYESAGKKKHIVTSEKKVVKKGGKTYISSKK
ncbi:MAG: hypothetical protein IK036_00365 [Clostridia bacterium]|nr:hypothetical protein [Clostridia bacterium]MBR5976556.1 hypothetical protein [Clostridia bacterium]MBR5991189.1 hypothetical protein [Clostridia bacterium]MBR6513174.1 hypothetical protein [Clostridia bacterium]